MSFISHRSIIDGISIFAWICWLCSNSLVFAAISPIVHIKNGTLEGTVMKSRNGREFVAFRGIPYAQPPLGELRFEPPKPFDSWTGVRSAKEDANMCTQEDDCMNRKKVVGDEDCLYLNVYSPKLPSKEVDAYQKNYPVMIYIHGGDYVNGNGHLSSFGPKFFLDHDVILVTLNYRLGPLGFFSTEDLVSPGNQGMKDQAQAIRWVNENIAAFNGDPNRVTIFGQSAGAASVHYHMISLLSRGLFHRAISQSGVGLCPWALSRPGIAKNISNKVGKLLDCPTDNSSSLIECMKRKNAVDIITIDRAFQVLEYCFMNPFRPVIEPDHPGAFLKEEPEQSLRSGNVAEIPWMTGVNPHEGAMILAAEYRLKDNKYRQLDEKFPELGPIEILYENMYLEKLKDNVAKSIRKFYLGDKKIDKSTRWNLFDLYTDGWFSVGFDNAIKGHLETLNSPVFCYFFAYKGSSSLCSLIGDPEKDYGVSHGDELQYLFPIGEELFPETPLTNEDYKMVDVMTGLWVNFAKTGNPTPEKTSKIPVKWKPVRTSRLEYFHIGNWKSLRMADNMFPDRVNFWSNITHSGKKELNKDAHHSKDEL